MASPSAATGASPTPMVGAGVILAAVVWKLEVGVQKHRPSGRPFYSWTDASSPAACLSSSSGIDVDGSRYVTIRNVDVDTAGDAIAVKATGKWPTSHITVTGSK